MRPRTPPTPDSSQVPDELRDPAAAVWHDVAKFEAFMTAHGWWDRWLAGRGVMEQMAGPSPRRRRRDAVRAWAFEAGVVTAFGLPDWHQLRALGLM